MRLSKTNLFYILSLSIILAACSSKEEKEGNNTVEKKQMLVNNNLEGQNFKGFKVNIEKSTTDNKDFRKVLYTAKHVQLVLMSLKPGEEIGEEVHADTDQFFRVEGGMGKCIIDGTSYELKDGDAIIIPAGAKHNVMNTDKTKELKLYTLYSPPHHKDGIVRKTKEEAKAKTEEFDGKTTEKSRN